MLLAFFEKKVLRAAKVKIRPVNFAPPQAAKKL